MTPVKGSGLGRRGGVCRRATGGTEQASILCTVSRYRPNSRDVSRMLTPSTITARRTRRYTSTLYIPGAIHRLDFEPMNDGGRYSIQSPKVSNLSAHVVQFTSADYIVLRAVQDCPSAAAAEFCTVSVLWVLDGRPREIAAAAPSFHLESVLPEEQASSALTIWLKAPMSTIQSWRDATGLCDGVTLGWSASQCLVKIGRHDAGGKGDRLGGRGRIATLLKGSQRVMAGWPSRRYRLPNIRCCRPLAVRSRGRRRR